MADKAMYLPGQDPRAIEANRAYQEALERMLQSLDARKNRLFDPTLLAFSSAMLTPGQTGSFGEALGRAAGAVRESEIQRAKEDQDLAKMRLELAGMGMNIEAQRARERAFDAAIGGGEEAPATTLGMQGPPPAGAGPSPGGPAQTFPVPPTGAGAPAQPAPPGFAGVQGIPVAPPDPKFLGRTRYLQAARLDPSKTLAQAMKEAEDLERGRYQTKEGGVLDVATGMFFQFPKGESVERVINNKTFKIPASSAALLDLYQSTNDPKYRALADQLTKTGVGGEMKSETERALDKLEAEELTKGRAATAVKKEGEAEAKATTARQMLFNANRVQQLVGASPQAFGIFARPGMISAIGNLVNEGIRAGNMNVQLGGFENTVRQMMPGIRQEDIDRVTMAAGALAEIELAYTVLYMQKQGAITEGEREVVRRIGGGTSQSPGALMQKAKLVQIRSQHDINVNDAWRNFQDTNPKANYNDFERSAEYRNLVRQYDQTVSSAFNVAPPRSNITPNDMRVRRVGQ